MSNTICVIASHINKIQKYNMLIKSIQSILCGTLKPNRFVLSLSIDSKVEFDLTKIKDLGIEIILRSRQYSQFEHIFDVTKNYLKDIDSKTKILFFDDDDLAHSNMLEELVKQDYEYCTSQYDEFVEENAITYEEILFSSIKEKKSCDEFGGSLIEMSLIRKYLKWIVSIDDYDTLLKTRTHDHTFRGFISKIIYPRAVNNARFMYRKNYSSHHC